MLGDWGRRWCRKVEAGRSIRIIYCNDTAQIPRCFGPASWGSRGGEKCLNSVSILKVGLIDWPHGLQRECGEKGVREASKAWAAKDGVALSWDGMKIQRGKVRNSVLDTKGKGCLLDKPRGWKGCAQACIQRGTSEQPVGHLNPDLLPLIPLCPPPSIISGFLGL